ncbi:MAG: iron-containing alcohol dehydrogenase [Rickettsiales bacterium]
MLSNETKDRISPLIKEIPLIISESSLRNDIDDLLAMTPYLSNGCSFAVVDDINTTDIFGNRVFSALRKHSKNRHISFEASPTASMDNVNYIRQKSMYCDAIIAVGSGTINDLCKYAAYLDKKPYVVFPTAASMNGYLSASASIEVDGHKSSQQANLPKAVFCDLQIIAQAPVRLTRSGLGDCLARPTAQCDWLLSRLLLATNYIEDVFLIQHDIEEEVFENASAIAKTDFDITKKLLELLLISGLGMTAAKGSYPASQGEHMIAHCYNMLQNNRNEHNRNVIPLHGEEIGITSLYMAELQENLLKKELKLKDTIFNIDEIKNFYGSELTIEFSLLFEKKQKLLMEKREKIKEANWDDVKSEIEKIMMGAPQIESILKKAGCHTKLENIGWNREDFNKALSTARFSRDRFTFLDLE